MRAFTGVFLVVGVRATATAAFLTNAAFERGVGGASWCWCCVFAVSFGDDFVAHDAVSLGENGKAQVLPEK